MTFLVLSGFNNSSSGLTLCAVLCFLEQDESLEKLEETVISTKHIALAVNEELDLHTSLIVC